MQRIKTFESFNIYEGNEAGFMQRDPMVGMKDIVSQIEKKLNEISDQVMDKLTQVTIPETEVKKIADFMMDTFGTLAPKINKENAELLSKKLGLTNLHVNESYKKGENLAVKIIGKISQILGLNAYTGGLAIPMVIVYLLEAAAYGKGDGIFLGAWIAGFAVLYVFVKIMELFGYDSKYIGHGGDYNPHIDIRNPNSYPRKSLKNKIDNFKNKIGMGFK